ncbi:MAG: T9SS type A sorting domain-containing protein, partial [Flavobacteriales bacterium]|nr:T9SS type A sorting domain-containing protein [Flavobacteriales bacterium]
LPISNSQTGRIGLAISASNPNIVMASYATDAVANYFDALYKSSDNGNSWAQVSQSGLSNAYSSFGWYFGNLRIDPNDPNNVYVVGFDLYKSSNGGVNFSSNTTFNVHVDQHALWIDPSNSSHMILGNDGGLYETSDGGSNWNFFDDFPITQFYTCHMDYQTPSRIYGGTQDNNTIRTMTGALDDWQSILGGDGFYTLVDPTDDDYVYAEYQWGNLFRSTNGGSNMSSARNGVNTSDRFNWNAPLAMDPQNPSTLYFGSHRVYKSTNRAASWTSISSDLTNGPGNGNLSYGTLTTIAVSPLNSNIIYVGTEDGNVWNTSDGGNSWNKISASLPKLWCTRVVPYPYDMNTAFVTFSGYPWDDYLPHVFKTTDNGATWSNISANLPSFPVNDLIVDPDQNGYLYLASDYGVYVSWNHGVSWSSLGTNMPNVPVFDLEFHQPTRTLLAGTHGRSMYSLDLNNVAPVSTSEIATIPQVKVYPNPATEYITVELSDKETYDFSVFDTKGSLVKKNQLNGTNQISLTDLQPGYYNITINSSTIDFKTKLLIND